MATGGAQVRHAGPAAGKLVQQQQVAHSQPVVVVRPRDSAAARLDVVVVVLVNCMPSFARVVLVST